MAVYGIMTLTWISQAEKPAVNGPRLGEKTNANTRAAPAMAMPLPALKSPGANREPRSQRQAWPTKALGNILLQLLSGHSLSHVLAALSCLACPRHQALRALSGQRSPQLLPTPTLLAILQGPA